jgi:hypothetical protein
VLVAVAVCIVLLASSGLIPEQGQGGGYSSGAPARLAQPLDERIVSLPPLRIRITPDGSPPPEHRPPASRSLVTHGDRRCAAAGHGVAPLGRRSTGLPDLRRRFRLIAL